ncbi:MAG TPA: cytochrome b/b6 domain-containing protein [Anaerolineales bacterium]
MNEPQASSPPKSILNQDSVIGDEERRYLRFTLAHRIEHWIFMLSFTTLGLTGLVQKYASNDISIAIIRMLGGIETTRYIHHIAAIVMMIVTVYHIGIVGYRMYVQRVRLTMLPNMNDISASIQAILYNLGLGKNRPQQGRYTFEEKFEYWAVVWGTVVMVITGFMMWNPIASARFLPGEFIPAAKAAHGGEALLAVLAIIIWHMYHVVIRHFNKSIFTGYLTEEEMLEDHPLELADLKAGIAHQPPDIQSLRKWQRIYLPAYAIVAAILLAGLYFFVNFEQTAIATVPQAEQADVYVPLTPTPLPTHIPTRTPIPGGLTNWEGGIGALLQQRCQICHNEAAKIGGLDLSTYQGALTTGASGPAVVPGDPDNSPLIIKQMAGGHAEQLSEDEISQLRDWILAGAPEN